MSVDTATALDRLNTELRRHGHIVDLGQQGVVGRGPEFEAIADAVWRRFFAMTEQDTPILSCPPVISAERFLRTDYVKSFPHLTGQVSVFTGGDQEHRSLIAAVEGGHGTCDHFHHSPLMLVPAPCEQVYPQHAGELSEPVQVGVRGWCFRHEPSDEPWRVICFRICEMVHLGTDGSAARWREEWHGRIVGYFERLLLPVQSEIAHDPFFGRVGRLMARNQVAEGLKSEIRVPLLGDGHTISLSSSNAHRQHFAERFGVRLPDGEWAHTSCAGFGIERVVLALLAHHGMRVEDWPAAVRAELHLD